MSNFTFLNPKGQEFTIKGPAGLTLEQAQAIFKQQLDAGSLTGFKVGEGLSAATQFAGGLKSAEAAAKQAVGSLTGGLSGALGSLTSGLPSNLGSLTSALPAGTNLNSITASIGALGGAAASQLQSSLAGGAAAFNSLTTGASAAVGAISKGLSATSISTLPGINTSSVLGSASGVLDKALTGIAGQVGSVANDAVKTISGAVTGIATNGINLADFAKQAPALGAIAKLTPPDVTATLASASKMVGQAAGAVSNALGVGKFGFDASQLEKAGVIKPGTAAAFLAAGEKDLVEVLKTPTVWTGKDGIKGLDGLLKNTAVQDKIQQGLMKTGLNAIKSAGVPVDALTSTAVAGLATMAAKSVGSTLDYLKNGAGNLPALPGLPAIPGADALTKNVKSAFDNIAKNSAFAVNLSTQKIEPPFKQETTPEPAAGTANTETVSAAATRVVGNEKIPEVTQSDGVGDVKAKIKAYLAFTDSVYEQIKALEPTVNEYEAAASISQQQWETLNSEYLTIAALFNSRQLPLQKAAVDAQNALPEGAVKITLARSITAAQNATKALAEVARALRKRIKDLANKIATAGEQQ
jgi:hypothetical protein